MSNESAQVRAYGDGSIYVAPVGTAFPATIDAAIPAGWTQLGFVTEDGVVPEFGQDTTDVGAWQSGDPVRILLTKKPKKIDFSLLQVNADTMELALGGGDWTEPSAGLFLFEPADESFLDERALILEAFDGDIGYRICYRKALKDGAVTFPLSRTKASEFKISMRILAADGGAKPFLIQTNDPAIEAGS
jgi:hypothetical protein